eukprot:CAMPEP_0118896116 /NCGR_PEP_ID=MMETSP1166-20130328/4142_1 /TAXON_ID=1104430 /ORGANISM="Chrysoreinhardia sp, Strain CCMP3193" /LENGTH=58 /DNA_ID=CAMNT_0006835169 /DNA_START=261 /DNA_END=434 /DNA_ORIENTATION=-
MSPGTPPIGPLGRLLVVLEFVVVGRGPRFASGGGRRSVVASVVATRGRRRSRPAVPAL